MVMTTNKDGIQELWVDKVLNETMLRAVIDKIEHDSTYLSRIEGRYRDHHQRLTGKQHDSKAILLHRLLVDLSMQSFGYGLLRISHLRAILQSLE